MFAPAAVGNSTTGGDDSPLNTAITAATSAGSTLVFGDGTWWVASTVHFTCSYTMTPNTIIKGITGYSGVVADTPLGTQVDHLVFSGGQFDAGGSGSIAFWAHWATHCTWSNSPTFHNAQTADLVIGDPADGAGAHFSYGLQVIRPQCDRTAGSKVPGGMNIHMTSVSTDCTIRESRGNGQECGIFDEGNDNNFYTPHHSNQPVVCYLSVGVNSDWIEPIADTCQPLVHGSASTAGVSSTITDSAIQPIHLGLPVTGTNIPGSISAPSFVGTVTAGVSFALVNAAGGSVSTAGAVAGITLAGVGLNLQTAVPSVIGGNALMSNSLGVDNACFGVCFGPAVTNAYVHNFSMWAQNAATRWVAPVVGKTGFGNWMDLVNDGASCHNTFPNNQLNTAALYASIGTVGPAVTSQPVTSGVAFQPNTVKDVNLYIPVATGGTMTITMGPTTGAENAIGPAAFTVVAGQMIPLHVPYTWRVVITLVTATLGTVARVTC
jgi:hypothetical protein